MIRMWNKVFKSRFLKGLENQLIYYFYVLVAILILFFLDAIREMQKYSSEEQQQKTTGMSHLDAQMQMHMRLFRAQRNFYIAGYDHECSGYCILRYFFADLLSSFAWLSRDLWAWSQQMQDFRYNNIYCQYVASHLVITGGSSTENKIRFSYFFVFFFVSIQFFPFCFIFSRMGRI